VIGFSQIGIGALLIGAVFVSGLGYGTHRANQRHEMQRLKAMEAARQFEANWQTNVEALNEVHHAEVARLSAALERARVELRNRPDRMPEASRQACPGATGAELSRPDAEFLVGEAARADQLRADLEACTGWIEEVTRQ
jgi:hypothetical protein